MVESVTVFHGSVEPRDYQARMKCRCKLALAIDFFAQTGVPSLPNLVSAGMAREADGRPCPMIG